MRLAITLPLLLLAGLTLVSLSMRTKSAPESLAYIAAEPTPTLQSAQAYLAPIAEPAYAPIRDTAIADPVVDANVALLSDLDSGRVLYEKNASVKVPIASLTKLLSAVVATELFDAHDIVTIASESIRVDGQKQTLYDGERVAVGDLIAMMLVESSNDAAYALAGHARVSGIDFVARMNQRATQLGMDQCIFTNPAGLDDTAFCSATNLLKLVRFITKTMPELWSTTTLANLTVQSADGRFSHQLKNTDELLGTLDGILGGKTGNTDGALGCLILVVKIPSNSDTLVSIVLGSRSRFTDTTTLLSWVTAAYRWH